MKHLLLQPLLLLDDAAPNWSAMIHARHRIRQIWVSCSVPLTHPRHRGPI